MGHILVVRYSYLEKERRVSALLVSLASPVRYVHMHRTTHIKEAREMIYQK
jgi:hypothetical protein